MRLMIKQSEETYHIQTLQQYFATNFAEDENLTPLKSIISSIATAAIEIRSNLAVVAIQEKLHRFAAVNGSNASGDRQKSIDILADDILQKSLFHNPYVSNLISEEREHIVNVPKRESSSEQSYLVAYDPLDGSSNIECSIPTGTIFGIWKFHTGDDIRGLKGDELLGAGYLMYSSSTELVFSYGKGSQGFTLDPMGYNWYLTRENLTIPERGPYYSLNEGRSTDWPVGLQKYIGDIKDGKSQWKKRYSSRYVCSLVADVHRTLLYGGWAGNPRNHLRLLYEAAPLAYILEQSSGLGSNGKNRILSIEPTTIHHRLPVFLGSKLDILEIESYGDVQQLESPKYEA